MGVARSGLWAPDQYTYNHIPTITSSVRPPPPPSRVYTFKTNLMGGGGAYQRRGAYLRRGGLFDLEKTMVSVSP